MNERVFGLPDADYRSRLGVSKSALNWFLKSPAHYEHVILKGNRPEPSAAMVFGAAFDTLLLSPSLFESEYAIAPEVRRGTKAWDEFESANVGKRIIKASEFETIQRMVEALTNHPAASALLAGGESQVSYFWKDDKSGLQCKGRADYRLSNGVLVDVKTTASASPREFSSSIYNYNYHVQAAMYCDGEARASGAEPSDQFYFIAIEKEAPFSIGVYMLDPGAIAVGRSVYKSALVRLNECVESGKWPSYVASDAAMVLGLPSWAYS